MGVFTVEDDELPIQVHLDDPTAGHRTACLKRVYLPDTHVALEIADLDRIANGQTRKSRSGVVFSDDRGSRQLKLYIALSIGINQDDIRFAKMFDRTGDCLRLGRIQSDDRDRAGRESDDHHDGNKNQVAAIVENTLQFRND